MACAFEKYRKLIAWCEIAGLLHDVGKLSGVCGGTGCSCKDGGKRNSLAGRGVFYGL